MAEYLCISVTFLDTRFHGRSDGGEPEWPPSPLRLLQAIVAANADQIGSGGELNHALQWLEEQSAPTIITPRHDICSPYRLSVPNNAMDIVGKAWSRGNYFGSGDANPAKHRAMKTIRPVRMIDGDTVHYLWLLTGASGNSNTFTQTLIQAADRIVALGWGIDLVVGHGQCLRSERLAEMPGERWKPTTSTTNYALRTPVPGTLDRLIIHHDSFLHRIGDSGFTPVEALSQFVVTCYRRTTDRIGRPSVVFELRHDDDSFCRYPQRKIIHIAGMVRHLAIELMQHSPPSGVDDKWVERYVAGHQEDGRAEQHHQLSYIPLPSIGHPHADQAIRRVMITAPIGDDDLLEHLARRLAGQQLKPEKGGEFDEKGPPTLVRIHPDNIVRYYTEPSNQWASVTPVILPGHDDRKPARTVKLIEKALVQSGIEQPCTYEWGPFSRWAKSFSAHKCDRDKKPVGYFRPKHLLSQTAVHLVLRFENDLDVPGPLAIGAGRHCGFGIMARIDE